MKGGLHADAAASSKRITTMKGGLVADTATVIKRDSENWQQTRKHKDKHARSKHKDKHAHQKQARRHRQKKLERTTSRTGAFCSS